MAEFKPTEAVNNRLYRGEIKPGLKYLYVFLIFVVAVTLTFMTRVWPLKIVIFLIVSCGLLIYSLYPFVVLPRRRKKNLESVQVMYEGTISEAQQSSRGYEMNKIWTGIYKDFPVTMEETFEGSLQKGVYHNVFRINFELHKEFEIRRAGNTREEAMNPNVTSVMGERFVIKSLNHREKILDWLFAEPARVEKLVMFFVDYAGPNGDIQGRWLSIGLRTDTVTLVRNDFRPEHIQEIFDYLIELGLATKDIR